MEKIYIKHNSSPVDNKTRSLNNFSNIYVQKNNSNIFYPSNYKNNNLKPNNNKNTTNNITISSIWNNFISIFQNPENVKI